MPDETKPGGLSEAAHKQRVDAAPKGALATKLVFASVLTRRQFAAAVGIKNLKTVSKWEEAGVVTPKLRRIRNVDTYVFSERDVELGKRVRAILAAENGNPNVTLAEAARRARREMQQPKKK